MYALIRFFIADCSPNPQNRLGLTNPHPSCLKIVCCTFSAYHALKAQIRSGQLSAPINNHVTFSGAGAQLRRCWSVFAEAFAAEAGEFAINHRSFSLPKFIAFLTTGGQATELAAVEPEVINAEFFIEEGAPSFTQDNH